MVFSSLTFLLCYLPAVLIVYYLTPHKGKNLVLFVFSLLFYAWGEPIYVGLMIFSTVLDYCCGRAAEKHHGTKKAKIALIVSVTVNLGLLCLFKYTDFILTTINSLLCTSIQLLKLPLPIGISFYTFQTMSYTIDVYQGAEKYHLVRRVCIAFSAAYRRTDCPLPDNCRADRPSRPHVRSLFVRREAVYRRTGQKGASREQHRTALEHDFPD